MRILKIIITSLLCAVVVSSFGCRSESDSTVSENQIVTVQRGNLTIDITGVGNLALSQKEDLAFEIPGTVAEVLVKEGDTVAKGQVLAKLDTSEWEVQLSALEDKVTAAERQLTAKKRAVITAERQLETKKRNVTAKERDVLQTEINLKDAQTALEKARGTYTVADFLAAQAEVDAAKTNLETALLNLSKYEPGTAGYNIKRNLAISAQSKLKSAQAKLDDMLSGIDEEVTNKEWQVKTAQWNLETAQIAVEDAQIAVEDAQKDIADAQLAVKDAQKALDDAQKALDEAKSNHPEIIAPSAGFITKVNVIGGDEVTKGTVAVTLADPNKFEADIMVNETDILQTKLGGNASVQVEAMPGMSLPAKVTHIAPTAVIQSGVVNYKVKVELESLQSVMPARQQAMSNLSSGNVTSPRRPTGSSPFSGNVTSSRQGRTGAASGQIPAVVSSGFQLREGQTVTVSILVAESNNVLLVPNSAITRRGMESMVKVLKDGVVEERSITTGISNWQYTEVSGGLSEGEQIIVPQATATTSTTSQQTQPSGRMFIPGMGGFGR